MDIELLAKQGRTKIHSGLAGIDVNQLMRLRKQTLRNCFSSFEQDENRLEFLARVQEIEFFNDAASQTPNSTWFSLENMCKPTIWVACSDDGITDFTSLIPMALEKVKTLIYFGDNNTQYLKRAFAGIIPTIIKVDDLESAVYKAFYLSEGNEAVLFSPACKTQHTVEELGHSFKRVVQEL